MNVAISENILVRIIQHDIQARDCNPILNDTELESMVNHLEYLHYKELTED